MRALLDTHAWLWWIATPDRLGASARGLIADRRNRLMLSTASALEIAIKNSLGKLALSEPPEVFVPAWVTRSRVEPLAVELGHALKVSTLPFHHRDPFDRILIAQAQVENLPIVTADEHFSSYAVEVIRAR